VIGSSSSSSRLSHEQFRHALQLVVDGGEPLGRFSGAAKIGEGSTGTVYVARDLHAPGAALVAIKKMNLHRQQRRELLFNEVVIMRDFRHTHIVDMHASYLVGDELWVVMEYLAGGSLTPLATHASIHFHSFCIMLRALFKYVYIKVLQENGEKYNKTLLSELFLE
jgi:serine/threonine protein kinase